MADDDLLGGRLMKRVCTLGLIGIVLLSVICMCLITGSAEENACTPEMAAFSAGDKPPVGEESTYVQSTTSEMIVVQAEAMSAEAEIQASEEADNSVPAEEEATESEEADESVSVEAEDSVPAEEETPVSEEADESVPVEAEDSVPAEEGASESEEAGESVPVEAEDSVPAEEEATESEEAGESVPVEAEAPVFGEAEESVPVEEETPASEEADECVTAEAEKPVFEQEDAEAVKKEEAASEEEEELQSGEENSPKTESEETDSLKEDNIPLASEESILPEFETDGLILKKYNGNDATVVIPENIKVIGEKAFAGNKQIIRVVVPDTVVIIDNYAFDGCTSLEQIVLGPGSQLATIKAYAFRDARKLDTSFADPEKDIDKTAFTGITVPEQETNGFDNRLTNKQEITAESETAGEVLPLPSAEEQRTETEKEKPEFEAEQQSIEDKTAEDSDMEADEYTLPENVKVALEVKWDDEEPAVGSVAHLLARINGAENINYTLQWQWSADNTHWKNIHGATEAQYDMLVTEQNQKLYLRVRLSVVQ